MTKTALITGIGGQDGAYLAQLLVSKGYNVCGTSRDAEISHFDSLIRLGVHGQVNLLSMAPNDFKRAWRSRSKIGGVRLLLQLNWKSRHKKDSKWMILSLEHRNIS